MAQDANEVLSKNIKKIRLSRGETMEQFGAHFNTSRGVVSRWENGRMIPSPDRLRDIAALGHMSVQLLTTGERAFEDLTEEEQHEFLEKGFSLREETFTNAETIRERVAATMDDLIAINDFESLKSMGENAGLVRENATNKYRVEHSKDKAILDLDPFKKMDDERAENIKSPKYHMYFNGPTLRELTQLIKDTEKGDVPNDLVQRLKTIRDQVEKDSYRV